VGRSSTVSYDQLRRPVLTTQVGGTAGTVHTTTTYGDDNHPWQITDQQGNVVTTTYDVRGRRTFLVDPDHGPEAALYNGYGEVRAVQNPLGQTIYAHDAAGRVTQTTAPGNLATYFWYDLPGFGKSLGRLCETLSPDGVYSYDMYDGLGRIWVQDWYLHLPSGAVDYQGFVQTYDSYGRPSQLSYPTAPNMSFFAQTQYTPYGYVSSIARNSVTSPGTVPVWTPSSFNEAGSVLQATFGNGVTDTRTYTPTMLRPATRVLQSGATALSTTSYQFWNDGRLSYAADYTNSHTDEYSYDSLGRLQYWNLFYTGAEQTVYAYSDVGNLTQVTLAGATTDTNGYPPPGGESQSSGVWVGPHALVTRNGTSYGYDALGRQVSSSQGLAISYNSFDLPTSITPTAGAAPTTFLYDANRQRVLKTGPAGTTVSLGGGLYERRIGQGTNGGDLHVFNVQGLAQVVYDDGAASEKTEYFHVDLNGSTNLVTSDAGTVSLLDYHEPFGKRFGTTGAPLPSPAYTGDVRGGFAGHDYDDDLGYINMKGRIYDPTLRRFLTPDPFVSNPLDSQAYNRYSYVQNDPINSVDPTGFVRCDDPKNCAPAGEGGGDDPGATPGGSSSDDPSGTGWGSSSAPSDWPGTDPVTGAPTGGGGTGTSPTAGGKDDTTTGVDQNAADPMPDSQTTDTTEVGQPTSQAEVASSTGDPQADALFALSAQNTADVDVHQGQGVTSEDAAEALGFVSSFDNSSGFPVLNESADVRGVYTDLMMSAANGGYPVYLPDGSTALLIQGSESTGVSEPLYVWFNGNNAPVARSAIEIAMSFGSRSGN
jgi:RHS repeat-associated protein